MKKSYGLLVYHKYKKCNKYLLVQRRESYAYIQSCLYFLFFSEQKRINLLNEITNAEVERILTNSFSILWNDLHSNCKTYHYYVSKRRASYNIFLIKNRYKYILENRYNKTHLNIQLKWSVPKGGCNKNELPIKCAFREFTEETNMSTEHLELQKHINPIQINIFHKICLFYIVKCVELPTIQYQQPTLNHTKSISNETCDVKWFSIKEIQKLPHIQPSYKDMIYKLDKILI